MSKSDRPKIDLSDPETKAVWDSAQSAKEEVASWPAWKRGEDATSTPAEVAPRSGGCVWCGAASAFEWCSWCTALRQAARFATIEALEQALAAKRSGLL